MPDSNDALPLAAKKWNWGAMWLNVFWGLKHNTDFALLTLIPGLGLIVPIILGARGGRWAWRNRVWASVEEFEKVQRDWALWGWAAVFFIAVSLFIPVRNFTVDRMWERSAAVADAVRQLQDQPDFQKVLGANPKKRVYEVRRLGRERFQVGVRLEGQEERLKIRLHLMRLEGAWLVYRAVLLSFLKEPGVDCPLPPALLASGPPAPGPNPPQTYDCRLRALTYGQERTAVALAADLNHWPLEETRDRLKDLRTPVCAGVSWAAARKLQAKFADYGLTLDFSPHSTEP
ncbi:MAG: hypothetical protein AB1439_06820 [candidate division FCPU426 bacterium]